MTKHASHMQESPLDKSPHSDLGAEDRLHLKDYFEGDD